MRPAAAALAAGWLAGCASAGTVRDPWPLVPVAAPLAAGVPRPEDRAAAAAAELAALEESRVVEWAGSGVWGRIAPLRAWTTDGRWCRAYSHTVRTPAAIREWRTAACRGADGRWVRAPARPDAR